VRDIRAFFHRVADGVKTASKQTWGAIREKFTEDDEEAAPRPSRQRSRGKEPQEDSSFARSKEAVPYRYDDAEAFEAESGRESTPDDMSPKINLRSRDTVRNGPFTSPGEPAKTETPDNKKPFVYHPEPEAPEASVKSTPLPEKSPSSQKTYSPIDDGQIEFARPVPGKRGLVYPPGAAESPENLVDITGFLNGQIVRDPRTGKLFRVP
jgi:hypothetical protein